MTGPTVANRLRPTDLSDYVGQAKAIEEIDLAIRAARGARPQRPMEHVLLDGPSGCGKTTLAGLIAQRLDDEIRVVEMPLRDTDYRGLSDFQGVLFLDELHRGSKSQQEDLLPLLEHGHMQPPRHFRLDFTWLTVIGATTEPTKVIRPLRDRFPLKPDFEEYSDEQMTRIVSDMAGRVGVELTADDAAVLGHAAAGMPRTAAALVQTAQNWEIANECKADPLEVLRIRQLDTDGLGPKHRQYLNLIWKWGTVGLAPLKSVLGKDEAAILEVEQVLIRQDLVILTPQGRQLTATGAARVNQQNRQNGNTP